MRDILVEFMAIVMAIMFIGLVAVLIELPVHRGNRTAEVYHPDGTYSTIDITEYRIKDDRIILKTINGYEWDLPQEIVEVTKE